MKIFRRNLFARLRAFARQRGGNVAITFALATLPVVGAVGAAVDFSHANAVKAAMQNALDSTALMLSKNAATLSNSDLQTKALAYFTAVFTRPEATNVTIAATYTPAGSSLLVTGSAKVPTSIMGVLGYNNITVNGSATAKWGTDRLRVALALDNTGSMADAGKLTALKSATHALLTQLQNAASTNGDVYVSIIPFNKDVNIGASNYTSNWLDWTAWDLANSVTGGMSGSICYNGTLWQINGGSIQNGGSCSGTGGGICNNGVLWKFNGVTFYNAGTCTHTTWNGCVTDRGNSNGPSPSDYDRNVTAPTTSILASLFPTEQFGSCPVAMQGLTYDWTALNNLVDSMVADGNTNQPIGLVWAWQSLVGGGPLTAPSKDPNYTYKEYIILMSDGLNTANRWSTSQTQVDKRMYDASSGGAGTCANIKAAGITIYSIQVNTGGDPTSTIMQNCASDSTKFWEIKTAGDLGTVFNQIGTNLTKLRVAR